jgi:hypothetical protein
MPVGMPLVPAANAGSRALARGARQQQCWMPRSLMTSEENSGEIPPTSCPVAVAPPITKSAHTITTGAAALPLTTDTARRAAGVPSKKQVARLKKTAPKPTAVKPRPKPAATPKPTAKPNEKALTKAKRMKMKDITPPVVNCRVPVITIDCDERKMPALGGSDDSVSDDNDYDDDGADDGASCADEDDVGDDYDRCADEGDVGDDDDRCSDEDDVGDDDDH